MIVAVIVTSIVCAVGGQLSWKSGMNRVGRVGRRASLAWQAGALALLRGLSFYLISMVTWLFVLSRVELSFAFPFVSLSYVAILVASRLFLGEQLGRSRVVGSALIVSGVLLVGLS